MEDFDIYDDLDEFTERAQKPSAEVAELGEQLKSIKEQLNEAHNKHEQLLKVNKTLKYNISTIMLTARRELNRKEDRINSLIKEKDEIIFRRGSGNSKYNQTLNNKSTMQQDRPETIKTKSMSDKGVQAKLEDDKNFPLRRNRSMQTEIKGDAKKLPSYIFAQHKGTQTYGAKYLQTIRYVGWQNTVFKTEQVELKDYIEKKHQTVQTDKLFEDFVAKKNKINSKSAIDNSDAVESLLSLSQGCPSRDQPQNLLNNLECEKLLTNPKIILNGLSKEISMCKAKPMKSSTKPANQHNPKLKQELNSNLGITDLHPQINKSKPIRQYGSGKGKHILNQQQGGSKSSPESQEVIIIEELDTMEIGQIRKVDDNVTPSLSVVDKNKELDTTEIAPSIKVNNVPSVLDTEMDTMQIALILKAANAARPSPSAVDKEKKIETENVKQSRKQKFTDIKTNCNLEHIPTEVVEIPVKKLGSKSKAKNTRKRRLDALFDESMDEILPKKVQTQKSIVAEVVDNISEIKLEMSSSDKGNNMDQVLQDKANSTPLALHNIKNEKKSTFDEPEPPPLPPSIPELPPPPPPSDNPELPGDEHEPPPLPPSPIVLPPPPLPSSPVKSPPTNIESEIKPIYTESESPTPVASDLSPLLTDKTIDLVNSETPTENETPVGSQDFGNPENAGSILNSSIEIKMSTSSYKIETHGDETTVYIKRNKKKKKRSF